MNAFLVCRGTPSCRLRQFSFFQNTITKKKRKKNERIHQSQFKIGSETHFRKLLYLVPRIEFYEKDPPPPHPPLCTSYLSNCFFFCHPEVVEIKRKLNLVAAIVHDLFMHLVSVYSLYASNQLIQQPVCELFALFLDHSEISVYSAVQ